MKLEKDLKYEEALERLQEIVSLLERKEIKIDDLADKVKEAKTLVEFCREKLDRTETEINKIIEPSEG
ncbi:exodeoxyribonuclease VII small subunit [Putridiphycobacter roseus]|uniref:Exodeoxyribonuclease VII small subunit n=1 Tax=Putridiphycobacter roseus TaxID=2219161 RepID=A0A2W1NRA1_9FLAO|nr:exodeoxyribonuclease VII small subunit [Putridiphycobacter roseus]PZE18132.1 exodeoxyribonuclease VII small subunit [Putridiphycobacter roseus]